MGVWDIPGHSLAILDIPRFMAAIHICWPRWYSRTQYQVDAEDCCSELIRGLTKAWQVAQQNIGKLVRHNSVRRFSMTSIQGSPNTTWKAGSWYLCHVKRQIVITLSWLMLNCRGFDEWTLCQASWQGQCRANSRQRQLSHSLPIWTGQQIVTWAKERSLILDCELYMYPPKDMWTWELVM